MSQQKWTRSSLRELARQMNQLGYRICHVTVGEILRSMGFALRVNAKKVEGRQHPDRDLQFRYIDSQRQAFMEVGLPVISVDTKKKELVGNFKNSGRAWCKEADAVNVHDFPQDALGRAVPYGIYDIARNHGFVRVGNSADTAEFAVDTICRWWDREGQAEYRSSEYRGVRQEHSGARQLLILADGGGSNGYRLRLWKQQVQEKLCDERGLEVTVSHYPTGCSKWNPLEHRLFGPISENWAGKPLRTWEALVGFIGNTTNRGGLTVTAELHEQAYQKGRKVSDEEMEALELTPHTFCPSWNYTLRPRSAAQIAHLANAA